MKILLLVQDSRAMAAKKETEDPPVVFEQLHLFCNGIALWKLERTGANIEGAMYRLS